jgi:hypothetical protein
MSHTVSVGTVINSVTALTRAAEGLKAKILGMGRHKLYGDHQEGFGVHLRDWRYPVVFNLEEKKAHYDHFNGSWGKESDIQELTQRYQVERIREEAFAQGYTLENEPVTLKDGSLQFAVLVN